MRELPAGTVTFLFTDVEGSTRLLSELGEAYAEALARHRRVLLEAFARHDGVEVDTQGDAFFVAFARASDALAAAEEAQQVLTTGPLRVRMGLHTGEPLLTDEGYVGMDVHRAARIGGAGHGGQVVVSQTTRNLAPVDGLRDLGEHRLKDLSAPERLYQLGHQSFPPLKTLGRTNLPVPATPFLGRSRDLVAVVDLLGRRDVRVLTLVGPGGTGKTRLALQAAGAAADHYRDGVFWAPLATLRDPQLVLEAAGTALGAQRVVAEHIADKRLLLLLDNFEHVIEAAAQVGAVVAACPNLDVLVTSRELLQLRGEQAYLVPPLDVADGVELFLARARAQRPHFALDSSVPELCASRPATARDRASRCAHATPVDSAAAGAADETAGRSQSRKGRRPSAADTASDHRVVLRPALAGRAGVVRPHRDLQRWVDARRSRGDLRRGPRHAWIARRQEPRPPQRGALLAAGDDPRIRRRKTRGVPGHRAPATQARRVLPGLGRARRTRCRLSGGRCGAPSGGSAR